MFCGCYGWGCRGKKSYFIKELRKICLQIRSTDNQWQLFSLSPRQKQSMLPLHKFNIHYVLILSCRELKVQGLGGLQQLNVQANIHEKWPIHSQVEHVCACTSISKHEHTHTKLQPKQEHLNYTPPYNKTESRIPVTSNIYVCAKP
jgi:hypothetical protein